MPIRYRGLRNWRYQLVEPHEVVTPIAGHEYHDPYFSIDRCGTLVAHRGYCWDGPSGPVLHSRTTLRPSLVHDVFYQLIRLGVVPIERRKEVDDLFRRHLLGAGMGSFRAWYFYRAVRMFGGSAASADEPPPEVLTAP